jgi:tail tube protein gp19
MTLDKRSYTSGHFELLIDGHASTAYLKSVDGGFAKAQLIDEPVGPQTERVKHTSVVDIDPFTIDFGISGANDILRWIQGSWNRKYGRRNGTVSHANFNLKKTFEHEFREALITETSFPALDGSSKEAAYMKIKIQPEYVRAKKLSGNETAQGNLGTKQKMWMASGFRLNIDGIDEMKYTNKVEAFTIKQGIKKLYTGQERFPQIEPTKLEFPSISGTIALEYADKLLKWHDQYVMKGQSDPKAQKTGSIEFLTPQRDKTIFSINMYEMGLQSVQVLASQANQDQIKRVKFELYVGRMDLDGQYLGLE